MPNSNQHSILVIGAGAVGSTIINWIAPTHQNLYVMDQGETAAAIKSNGIQGYLQTSPDDPTTTPVNVIESFSDITKPDYIFVCVKNYSLDAVAKSIIEAYGNEPTIVAFQNGAENQEILPKHFKNVIYGVVCYNAWLDMPGVVGYQKKGPLVIGTPDNSLQQKMSTLKGIMEKGVETVVTHHLNDAVMSKIIINLTNSFTTLVGFGFQSIDDEGLFQKILSNLTFEGTQIAKAAGYNECKLGGMPSWLLIRLSASLPQFLTRGLFRKNVAKMVVSSMAQDIITNHIGSNELESINGYMLEKAAEFGVDAPYNRAIYHICNQHFSKGDFKPISTKQTWLEIQDYLKHEKTIQQAT